MTAGAQTERPRDAGAAGPETPPPPSADGGFAAEAAGSHRLARIAFAAVAVLFVGCVLVQVFLVGLDAFAGVDASIHRAFAYTYGWLTPVLVLLAGFARAPRATRNLTVVMVVLFAIQVVLPSFRYTFPPLAAIHSINALAIFAVAVTVATQAVGLVRGRTGGSETGQ